ncbi:MAG: metallophosphoesterase [Rhodanobacteraceae bacterium]
MARSNSRSARFRHGAAFLCSVLASQLLWASPRKIDDYHWTGVDRIVAIGDIHGDYASYIATLKAAGIVDQGGRWQAGDTHLVQVGDIPDRGADTAKIIAHMRKLADEAEREGGRVHNLMGNHEAMNVYGDLRYTSAGEYAALAGPHARELRDRYYANVLADLKARDPERFATLPKSFRQDWNSKHPLGWVEHQQAWNPRWNPQGQYFEWVMREPVAIELNDMIFVHGGISASYCQNSLASLTDAAHQALRKNDPLAKSILNDPQGPLWYRGLSGDEPEASAETVQAILQHHVAHYIVVGHTPTAGIVWPRYAGRVIQIDVGMTAYYGGHVGYLEVTSDGLFAGYRGGKIKLPDAAAGRLKYLQQVVALQPDNSALKQQLAALEASPTQDLDARANATQPAQAKTDSYGKDAAVSAAICGISP